MEIGPTQVQAEIWKDALLDVAEFLKTYSVCYSVPPGTTESSIIIGGTAGDDWEDRYYLLGNDFEGLNLRLGIAITGLKEAGMRPPLIREEPAKAVHVAYDAIQELAGALRSTWTIRSQLRLPRTPNEIAAIFHAAIDDPNSTM